MNATPSAKRRKPRAPRAGRVAPAHGLAHAHRGGRGDAERHHVEDGRDLQGDLVRRHRARGDAAHQQRRRREQPVLQEQRAGDRQSDRHQLGEQPPVRTPEAPEHAVLLEGVARVGDPDGGRAHADVDERGGEPGAHQVERRQPKGPVDQRIGEHRIDGDGDQRDPQRRLGPVDRAHEVAQRDEDPRREDRPGHAREIAAGQRGRLGRLAEREQDLLAPELQQRHRHAQHDGGPQADPQRPAHHARLPRAIGLGRQRRHGGYEPHADGEGGKQHRVRQRGRRQRRVAQAADQRQVGRHHDDLAELDQRHRQRQPHGLDELGAPKARPRRHPGGGGDGFGRCHRRNIGRIAQKGRRGQGSDPLRIRCGIENRS